MKEEKEDVETATATEETIQELEPTFLQRLNNRMIFIKGILLLDFFVVFLAYGMYNSYILKENKGWQEMFINFYRVTFVGGVVSTLCVIFDVDNDFKGLSLLFYVVGIFCCLFMALMPFIVYFLKTCYTTVVPWLSSGVLGGVLGVIWNLSPI